AAVVVHPNIVRLYDAGTDEDGTAWQVFELLEGRDLASLIEERTLSVNEAVWLAGELLEALEAVHARGFVHRDIKPENVFLATAAGNRSAPFHVKLLDFGIAKPLVPSASTPWVTDEGVMLGTPHFMAPEQIAGDKPIAPTTDLWATGAVLFTALTGRPPFDDKQLSKLLVRIAREPAPSILPLRPDVPEALASIIARALRNHPAHRFPSASAMLAALDDALPQTLAPAR
ncbi:MAG: serine/threonine protein kinase, partial [Myxococcales bacterium]|nr:serine/threonine protein kinase [Myxococcales bacterium]